MGNTTSNVSFGKPKISGAIYNAPFGTTLPTDAVEELNVAFKCLGYVSEDGTTNSNSPTTSAIKAWGGDKVMTVDTDKPDEFKFKLLEILNVDVLKAVYGAENVTGTLATGITVRANIQPREASAWVIDMVLRNNVAKRIVIPNGTLTALEDIVYKDTEAVGYGVTISAEAGDAAFGYDTHKEYIKATANG